MIPIYIPSYNRASTIKTTKWLDKSGLNYMVLLHSEQCKYDYLKAGIVKEKNIIVTGTAKGITNQRNWMTKNLSIRGEWFISLDDNISGFKMVIDKYYHSKKMLNVNSSNITQQDYNQQINAKQFIELVKKDIVIADKINSLWLLCRADN